jgi:hypothetical protein
MGKETTDKRAGPIDISEGNRVRMMLITLKSVISATKQ